MRAFVLALMVVLAACFNSQESRLVPALIFTPGVVEDMGYCPDVSSPSCQVRYWWPRSLQTQSTGIDTYWLLSRNGQVCFVTPQQYTEAIFDRSFNCLWRNKNG